MRIRLDEVDPFDLPDWLGTSDVVWDACAGLTSGHLVPGTLRAEAPDGPRRVALDLLAVDEAYPEPVTDDAARVLVHQAWHHHQVFVAAQAERLTLAVPGRRFHPELVLDALGRFARAVGADPERYAAHLRISRDTPRHRG